MHDTAVGDAEHAAAAAVRGMGFAGGHLLCGGWMILWGGVIDVVWGDIDAGLNDQIQSLQSSSEYFFEQKRWLLGHVE